MQKNYLIKFKDYNYYDNNDNDSDNDYFCFHNNNFKNYIFKNNKN